MKANELRIGNWFRLYGKDYQITDGEDIDDAIRAEATPITLTEEWLLKFGFNNFHKRDYQKRGLFITTFFSIPQTMVDDDFGQKRVLQIKYVHQLQNLYFALTEEELNIN